MERRTRLGPVTVLAAALLLASPVLAAMQYTNDLAEVGIAFQQAGELSDVEFQDPFVTGFAEILGSGACLADFDGDGLDDLYLVSQQFNPENALTEGWIDNVDPHNKLYINRGDGTFEDRTAEAGVEGRHFSYGCSAADYDGDADVDLFVSAYGDDRWGGNQLFRNRGDATFDDVSEDAGVVMLGACGDIACLGTNSAWADYDLDGDLDLYVGNYVSTALDDPGHGPGGHVSQPNFLHRNNGDGTFTEVAEEAGVRGVIADAGGSKSFAVVWFDHDLDGDMDLYVANDLEPNNFYDNDGDGTFTERSDEAGLADPRASMGLAIADYDNDGYPDIYITHYTVQLYGFYRNSHDGTFEDRSGEDDLEHAGDWVGWGAAFVDFDRDGDLDIIGVNGHTAVYANNYDQPTKVFRNDPEADPEAPWDRQWTDVSDELGPGIAERFVSRGAAFGDYDLDGDIDFAVSSNANETAQFLRASGVESHWLNVRVREDGMNRDAIGAKVKLEAQGMAPQFREVQAGSSFLSQNTLTLEFGLADRTQADRITVTWPDGGTTTVEDVAADQTVRIERSTGSVIRDVLAPRTTITLEGTEGVDRWFRSDVALTLPAADAGSPTVSGVALTEFAVNDAALAPQPGGPLLFDADGHYRIAARSTDADGNVEPIRRLAFGIDRRAPAAAHALAGAQGEAGWWVDEAVEVTLAGEDDLSGVHEVRYRVDAGPWTVYEAPFLIEDDGEHTVSYFAIDRAGNDGATGEVLIKVDRTDPEVAPADPSPGDIIVGDQRLARLGAGPVVVAGTADATLTIEAVAADATSGTSRVAFVVDEVVRAVAYEGPPWTWTWDVGAEGPGVHRLQLIAVDVAGNLGTTGLDVLVLTTPTLPA